LNTEKQNIKAVTFDLWETLFFERDGASSQRSVARSRNLHEALDKLGAKIALERIDSALKETILSLLYIWETNKDVTHLDQIRLIIRYASNNSITVKQEWIDKLTSAYISPILEVPPYLNPDAQKVLESLRNRNKVIGIICNTGLTPGIGLRRLLVNEGVAEYFDLMIFSDEEGIRKPDPRIFHFAAQKLNIEPREAVHIGDNLKSDVWGAQSSGFKAIYFSSEEGRDRIAESDPSSLVSLSRRLGDLSKDQIIPDRTITSLAMAMKAIEELETA
jgi:putative hydrolase of the HAD superfamily